MSVQNDLKVLCLYSLISYYYYAGLNKILESLKIILQSFTVISFRLNNRFDTILLYVY